MNGDEAMTLLRQLADCIPVFQEQQARQNIGMAADGRDTLRGQTLVPMPPTLLAAIMDLAKPLPRLPTRGVVYVYHINRGAVFHMVDKAAADYQIANPPHWITLPSLCGEKPDAEAQAWGCLPGQAPPEWQVCLACRRGVNPYRMEHPV